MPSRDFPTPLLDRVLRLAALGHTDPYSVLEWDPVRLAFNLRADDREQVLRRRARESAAGAQVVVVYDWMLG